MKRDKKITRFVKKLVELSKDENGAVTEAKVGEVLAGLREVELRSPLATLKTYLGYVSREIALQTAIVSAPADLSAAVLKKLETKFSTVYRRPVSAQTLHDPSLIAGVRIRIGDDVYDSSIAGQLQRLAAEVR